MSQSNEFPSRPHEQRVDLDTLISKIKDFLSIPIPETPKGCNELYFDEGRNLLKDLHQYLHIIIRIDLAKNKISPPEFKPTGVMTVFQRMELPELHSRLQTRLNELLDRALTKIPLEDIPLTKTFLDSPKKPFDKRLKEPLVELRKFLRNDRVKRILKKFETIEDSTFVVFILLPLIYYETYEGEGEGGKMEKTFTMARPLTNANTSINEIILFLCIHFKQCLGKEHYKWIADLISLCRGEKWREAGVKMRLQRLKKSKGWNQEWEERLYSLRRGWGKDVGEDNGLNQLVRKYLKGRKRAVQLSTK